MIVFLNVELLPNSKYRESSISLILVGDISIRLDTKVPDTIILKANIAAYQESLRRDTLIFTFSSILKAARRHLHAGLPIDRAGSICNRANHVDGLQDANLFFATQLSRWGPNLLPKHCSAINAHTLVLSSPYLFLRR